VSRKALAYNRKKVQSVHIYIEKVAEKGERNNSKAVNHFS